MEWTDLIQKLIDLVEQTAPELWRIATRQVVVNGVRDLIFGLVFIAALIVSVGMIKKLLQKQDYAGDIEISSVIGLLLIGVCDLFFAIQGLLDIYNVLGYFLNPEYYAIRVLMDLVQ